jgi:ribulose-phosphate 3-epimerase
MDGHFVPNLTIGSAVTEAIREATKLPVDVHLMIERPEQLIPRFVEAGADRITVHQETCPHLHRVIAQIHDAGLPAGVALNPATPVETLRDIVALVDLVLVMTVNPGFGGQSFLAAMLPKIEALRTRIDRLGLAIDLEVDGGVAPDTIRRVTDAGATVLVAGNAVFGKPDRKRALAELRDALGTR